MPVRKYVLIKDASNLPVFGAEDGTRFYGIRPYNTYTVSNVDSDDGTGYFAELGVKDNDLYNLFSLANSYQTPSPTNSPSTDQTITFSATVHQVLIDNTRNSNPVYVEFADTPSSNSASPQIPAGAQIITSVNTTKIHLWCVTPTSVVVRAWS